MRSDGHDESWQVPADADADADADVDVDDLRRLVRNQARPIDASQ
jgi:hypothetical protein